MFKRHKPKEQKTKCPNCGKTLYYTDRDFRPFADAFGNKGILLICPKCSDILEWRYKQTEVNKK